MGELSKFTDDNESSPDGNKSSKKRWVRPPLIPSALDLHKKPTEFVPPPRPPLFEQMVRNESIEDPKESAPESEDDDSSEGGEQSEQEHNLEEVAEDNGAVVDAEAAKSFLDFEDSEFRDIPLIDDAKPQEPTFEELLEREMPADFARDTSGPELGGSDRGDIPPIPSWEMPSVPSPFDRSPSESVPPSTPARSESSFWPPREYGRPPEPSRPAEPAPKRASGFSSVREAMSGSGFSAALETAKAVKDLAELASNPYPMIARVLMEVAVKSYLEDRKQQRYQNVEQPAQRIQERIPAQPTHQDEKSRSVAEALRQVAVATGEQIFDQNGNEIVLQPGWHVERSTGGYSVVLDEHNRVVHDAIRYGEAFKHDQQREKLADNVSVAPGGGASFGTPLDDALQPGGSSVTPQFHTAASDDSHHVPQHTVDLQHRLEEPRSHLAAAVGSPWFWTAVAFLIIVYFIAALA